MPGSVKTVDAWLGAYTQGQNQGVVAATTLADQPLVKKALEEKKHDPSGSFALLLPPKPISYEIIEIDRKESDVRHVVLTRVRSKNPLPFSSKRVGQVLDKIPKTRSRYRKFLAVKKEGRWGVQLDLAAVQARARFARRFGALLEQRKFTEAKAMLSQVPKPPDEPNAVTKKDHLLETLQKDLEKTKALVAAEQTKP